MSFVIRCRERSQFRGAELLNSLHGLAQIRPICPKQGEEQEAG